VSATKLTTIYHLADPRKTLEAGKVIQKNKHRKKIEPTIIALNRKPERDAKCISSRCNV
jgi:hypothetical protein